MTSPTTLYFICDYERQFVKIGISHNPRERLFSLQAGCPLELRLDWDFEYPTRREAIAVESTLHAHFADHRIRREWFHYAPPIREMAMEWSVGFVPEVVRMRELELA